LEDQYIWDTRGRQAKELMSEMLKSRIEAQELARQYDIRPLSKPTQGSQVRMNYCNEEKFTNMILSLHVFEKPL
jgi:hypothetical protein